MPPDRLASLLRCLSEFRVEYILVGGLSAVLNGAPISTFDVDIVHKRSAENLERVLAALTSLDAIFRVQPERRLRPTESHLKGSGHLNLLTRLGPLDLLGSIGGGNLSYEELLSQSTAMEIDDTLRVRVLNLETLIKLKEELGGAKDMAALGLLRQTLREKRKNS